jgi:membrane-bound inhibitor of C-type lysozyme
MRLVFRTSFAAPALLSAAFGVGAQAQGLPQEQATRAATPPQSQQVRASFTCKAGRTIKALFTPGAQSSVTLSLSDGRQLVLPQALSGSGARYASADESLVFWNKGRTAFIAESGKRTYDGCVQDP